MIVDHSRVIEAATLHERLDDSQLVIVDVGKAELYGRVHIPGACFLAYGRLVANRGLTGGLLPTTGQLTRLFGDLGIDRDMHVVAYDEEGGGKAGRLLWTLDWLGHHRWSLLDGGIHAWLGERLPVADGDPVSMPRHFVPWPDASRAADAEHILEHLDRPDMALLDARSPAEYRGERRFARRAGHIPGAASWEWTDALDRSRNLRLRPADALRRALMARNITPECEVVCYCQTHHRSSLSYVILRHLGYERVRGYPGSWSDWGNRLDTPVER